MARFRRFRWLFFTLEDELELDILALLRAEVKKRSRSRPVVSSPLTGKQTPCELQLLRLLAQIPSDKWVAREEIVQELSIESGLLDIWAQQGLLLSDSPDPLLAKLRDRAEVLDSHQWHPHAAFFHFMLRGPDDEVVSTSINYQEIAQTSGERARSFVERHGLPPSAFYRRGKATVDLPRIEKTGGLYETLLRRRSSRAFDPTKSLAREDLAVLLYYVFGFHGHTRLSPEVPLLHRTSPSGGSLHPIEAYPLLIRVEGFAPGLYHYDGGRHSLESIQELDPDEAQSMASRFARGQEHAGSAAAVVILTARFHRNFWKYRRSDRTYTVILMDAAHLSQTFYLVAADLGLAAFYSAAIHPQSIEEALFLDGYQEGPIAVCACGLPPAGGDDQGLPFEPFIPRQTKR